MIASVHKRGPRQTLRKRRQEIERQLVMFGLGRGPRRLSRSKDEIDQSETRIHRLRGALEGLGQIFSAFGLYLSSRVDLLPAHICLELAAIADVAAATPFPFVSALIEREFGRPPEDIYAAFEETPFESRLIFQSHRAKLGNGQDVTVKIIHPEVDEQLECDAELLYLLKAALSDGSLTSSAIESAIEDFRLALRQQIDLLQEADAIEILTQDAEEFRMMKVPRVEREFCASRVLTVERLRGLTLKDVLSSSGKLEGEQAGSIAMSSEYRSDLARRLCLVWLRQVFEGSLFPIEPVASNILVLPDKQIAFTSGACAHLPTEPKANLWNYLIAVATENPERSYSYLLKELRREGRDEGDGALRQKFSQVVPFRDCDWASADDSNALAEYLFTHWRLASRQGYLPQSHLPPFYRGLFMIASLARQLAPTRDALSDGLQDVRLIVEMEKFREMMSLQYLGEHAGKYAAVTLELPQRFDQALTLMAEGSARLKLQLPRASGGDSRRENSSAVFTAVMLVLAAVALLAHQFTGSLSGGWAEKLGSIVFILIGMLLLRIVGRT